MLTLTHQLIKIAHMNIRTEKHGEEDVTAVDLKLLVDLPNDYLEDLAPGLLEALYHRDASRPDLLERLSMPRFPNLGAIPWNASVEDWELTIELYDGLSDYILSVDLDKLSFECKQGGTVVFRMRAKLYPSQKDIAAITTWLGKDAKMDLRISSVQEVQGELHAEDD